MPLAIDSHRPAVEFTRAFAPADAGISVDRTALHRDSWTGDGCITAAGGRRRCCCDLDIGDRWRETCADFVL